MEINLKKDQMTLHERWTALLNRQPMDRIPVYAFAHGFCGKHAGLTLADTYSSPQKTFNAIKNVSEKFGWQDLPLIAYAGLGAWEFGGEVQMPQSQYDQAPKVIRRPVTKPEDIELLTVPDVHNAGIYPFAMEVSKLQAQSGTGLIMFMIPTPWALACNICGMENIARWSLKAPDLVDRVQEIILPFTGKILEYWIDAFGTDRLLPWVSGGAASNNSLISPKIFSRFVLPYMQKTFDAVHRSGIKHIYVHVCGEHNLNLPYWAQLNYGDPGILSFGIEVDLNTAGKMFPNDIIMGNIDTAILAEGTPEQVYEATKMTIEKGKQCPGGFMLAPGCEMPPMAPEENMWAMMQAVSDFGWY